MKNMKDIYPTPYEDELLGILQEECAEVIQIISKIRRFGLHSHHPLDNKRITNQEHLAHEIGDIFGMVELLMNAAPEGVQPLFTQEQLDRFSRLKQQKIAALTASSPKGRSHAVPLAQGIAARGVVLAVEEDGKLLFDSKPVIHTSEASWKDEATRVAMLNPGKRVVALKVVGAVVDDGVRWE